VAEGSESVQVPVDEDEFKSQLVQGKQRFLAHVVHHALESRRRKPEDFLRHFPPEALMEGLASKADLRGRLLAGATGLKEEVAMKTSLEAATELLRVALESGATEAEAVLALFDPDDRVRFLDPKKLWAFVAEGDLARGDGIEFEIAKSTVAYILDRAIQEKLTTAREVVDGISLDKLAQLLPRAELAWILTAAVSRGRARKPFRDEDLLEEAPTRVLTEHVPLTLVWEKVIVPHIAEAHGLVDRSPESITVDPIPPLEGVLTVAHLPDPDSLDFSNEVTEQGDLQELAKAAFGPNTK